MKNRSIVALSAIVSTLAITGMAAAADYPGTPTTPANSANTTNPNPGSAANTASPTDAAVGTNPAASQPVSETIGTVQQVNKSAQSVQLQDTSGSVQTLKIGKGTEIRRDGQIVRLAQVKKGDTVTIKNPGTSL